MSISLCMIIKDEALVLDNFLRNIKPYVDEIIIVDTGSLDISKKIARKYTDKIYDFRWEDEFSKARNFSISKAKKEWILWLDPDEKISQKDLEKLKDLTENKDFLGYRFIQKTIVNNKLYVQGICKLFQNNKGIEFIYPVHESVLPSITSKNGKIGKTGIIIAHKSVYSLEKAGYYLSLIEKKAKKYPKTSALKEKGFMLDIMASVKIS
jgi:glycosyltransferase involved in cell wall biosynthesis